MTTNPLMSVPLILFTFIVSNIYLVSCYCNKCKCIYERVCEYKFASRDQLLKNQILSNKMSPLYALNSLDIYDIRLEQIQSVNRFAFAASRRYVLFPATGNMKLRFIIMGSNWMFLETCYYQRQGEVMFLAAFFC